MTATVVDWEVLEIPGVTKVIDIVAHKAADKFRVAEFDDARQEAMLLVAGNPALREPAFQGDMGLLSYRLWQQVIKVYRTEANRADRCVSYEDGQENGFEPTPLFDLSESGFRGGSEVEDVLD